MRSIPCILVASRQLSRLMQVASETPVKSRVQLQGPLRREVHQAPSPVNADGEICSTYAFDTRRAECRGGTSFERNNLRLDIRRNQNAGAVRNINATRHKAYVVGRVQCYCTTQEACTFFHDTARRWTLDYPLMGFDRDHDAARRSYLCDRDHISPSWWLSSKGPKSTG